MTKKTTTKKSGTIAYQLRRQNDLTGTATKKLKELVKAGKFRAMGAKNVRFYVKGSL